jgi:LacI family transcriptional regulator
VSDQKRAAVLQAIRELNYHPNLFAQGLASGQSTTLGVMTQLIASPIYDLILRGIVEKLHNSKFSPLIADGYWDAQREWDVLQTFLKRSVDGLIILGGSLAPEKVLEAASQVPTIVIARRIPELGCQSIVLEDFQGAYQATRFLIEAGHRRIAHITGIPEHQDSIDRRNGYLQALQDFGIAPDPNLVVQGDYTEASGVLSLEMLLTRSQTFSAIFCANDQMAYGARLALYRRGIRVPEDISLVGFDDQGPSAFMAPPLTTVGVPALDIGRAATQGLLDILNGGECHLPSFPLTLRVRESVARR